MVVRWRLYTAHYLRELSHLPENVGKRLVLIDGTIREQPLTGWRHGDLSSEMNLAIGTYVRQHRLGRVTAADTGYNLAPGTTLAPDIGFVSAARIPKHLPDGYVPFAPDLAVEIVSPANSPTDIHTKIEQYIKYGTRLMWVVYAEHQKASAYRPREGQSAIVEFIDIDGSLDGGDVLPGFKLPLRDLFKDE